jgi:hypothetical protein
MKPPYHDRAAKEIRDLFKNHHFPEIDSLFLRNIIQRCWRVEYSSYLEIINEIEEITLRKEGIFDTL